MDRRNTEFVQFFDSALPPDEAGRAAAAARLLHNGRRMFRLYSLLIALFSLTLGVAAAAQTNRFTDDDDFHELSFTEFSVRVSREPETRAVLIEPIAGVWGSRAQAGDFAAQGDPRWAISALGKGLARYLGIELAGPLRLRIVDPPELFARLRRLDDALASLGFDRLGICFYIQTPHQSRREYLEKYGRDGCLPLASPDTDPMQFVHDVAFHLAHIKWPPQLVQSSRRQTRLLLEWTDLLSNSARLTEEFAEILPDGASGLTILNDKARIARYKDEVFGYRIMQIDFASGNASNTMAFLNSPGADVRKLSEKLLRKFGNLVRSPYGAQDMLPFGVRDTAVFRMNAATAIGETNDFGMAIYRLMEEFIKIKNDSGMLPGGELRSLDDMTAAERAGHARALKAMMEVRSAQIGQALRLLSCESILGNQIPNWHQIRPTAAVGARHHYHHRRSAAL
jgi:hypothetical protein